MGRIVRILASVMETTRICAIRGPANVIVSLDGVAAYAIDHVRSSHTERIARSLATARTARNVHQQTVRYSVIIQKKEQKKLNKMFPMN